MSTDESMNVEFEGGVVALLRVVKMNEEKNVRPDVMFLIDVMLETLQPHAAKRTNYH